MNTVNASLILRNDTAARWQERNPVLKRGELGAEIDTGLLKIGDGTSAFNQLKYINVSQAFLEEELNKKVNSSGGIITGALTLNYTPSAPSDAVNKFYVDNAITSAGLLKRSVVAELPMPENVDENTIYMVKDTTSLGPDVYKEYMAIDGVLTQIGDTSVDLTNYIQKPINPVSGNLVAFGVNGGLVDTGVSLSTLTLNPATATTIGGVLSSTDDNSVFVNETGKMVLNRVAVNNLYVPDGDEFVLLGGGA